MLDNKWFHNELSRPLREFILSTCEMMAVVTYPHERFFEGLMIATSMLIVKKGAPDADHQTCFVRVDKPGSVAAAEAAAAIRGGVIPSGWTLNHAQQSELSGETWKPFFTANLVHEFRDPAWPSLEDLFDGSRRGSLAKEGGGVHVFEFPQERHSYGPRRSKKHDRAPFQTVKGARLSGGEENSIRSLAGAIPSDFLGYAINKSDRVSNYEITLADIVIDRTIEAPIQRSGSMPAAYQANIRTPWNSTLDSAVAQIKANPDIGAFVAAIENVVGLDETVLNRKELWNALREPYAGELIIPRKLRRGHRVHINPFAFNQTDRQVRLSSNFLTYAGCNAINEANSLNARIATQLIAAWLMSSFGHLQFEIEAVNREGVRSIEKYQLKKIKILDPRLIRTERRQAILDAFCSLPYPIRSDVRPELQNELVVLDRLFADEVSFQNPALNADNTLLEIWDRLHEMHEARNH